MRKNKNSPCRMSVGKWIFGIIISIIFVTFPVWSLLLGEWLINR